MPPNTQKWRVHGVRLDIESDEETELATATAKRLKLSPQAVQDVALVKRSFDARGRPRFVYTVDVDLDPAARIKNQNLVKPVPNPLEVLGTTVEKEERVAVVGAGPAGIFAAFTLARAGMKPVLFDRGKPVETRGKDVGALINRATLDPESNLCFGEGGAGTWSDGKLTTRIGASEIRFVLETLHEMGGPERILVDGKPHLGTDKLVKILKNFRAVLIDLGVDIRYSTRVDDLIVQDGAVTGLVTGDGGRHEFDRVILAVGHSARDLYERLLEHEIQLTPKPFSMGFRVEHPQALINEIQYGRWAEHPRVPTADYRLSANFDGPDPRGVYSFCMCPGGVIMPTATRPGEVVVNGMSNASRSGRWANAALVVSVTEKDFAPFGNGPLAGADMQRKAEQAAGSLGGGDFKAPGQTVTDFLQGKASTSLRKTTYRPGVTPSKLDSLYTPSIIDALKAAIQQFEQRMPGFITEEAVLHGVETRTSAPVRIERGDDLQSVSVRSLYPAGEGAGYAGGIVSAAVDGIRCAKRIVEELGG